MKPKYYYFYFACIKEQDGKRYATVECVSDCESVLWKLAGYESANAMPTKKKAHEVVDFWNDCFRKNGTYMFADSTF